ncbi:protein of unknown function [Candidatus Methylomirabilis oxygeniifera]|uniref:Uncharacterized protein n=1 Tax=Methylomirabilis oxygeniifera TaxID=671143 RepID=D5MK47_METO1|nr:protein of unknown function [Candidatus Methylomirabilis oxyfera]
MHMNFRQTESRESRKNEEALSRLEYDGGSHEGHFLGRYLRSLRSVEQEPDRRADLWRGVIIDE